MLELIGGTTILVVLQIFFLVSRYKRCPADKILIVYGKTGNADMPEIYTGGGVFVWPVLQDFAYLDRTPLTINAAVKDTLDEDGFSLSISGVFVVAIGETKTLMEAAANRLLTLSRDQIINLCEEVVKGQLRLVVNALASVELNDRKQLVDAIYASVNEQLNTIGLQLLNVDLNEVRFSSENNANQVNRTSTEAQNTMTGDVNIELKPYQLDALLKGETINLVTPGNGNIIRVSAPKTTN